MDRRTAPPLEVLKPPLGLDGDAVFERLRVYGGRIFRGPAHVARLFASARTLALPIAEPPAAVERALSRAVARSGLSDATLRIAVARDTGAVQVVVEPLPDYPAAWYEEGVVLVTLPARAHPPAAQDPKVKSHNRLSHVLATAEATARGAWGALFVTQAGLVTEGTTSNLFIVRRGALTTPPLWLGVLDGITRVVVIELAGELGIPTTEEPLTRMDCYVADELFLTNTTLELLPVRQLDGRVIGTGCPGPVTRTLRGAFARAVRRDRRR